MTDKQIIIYKKECYNEPHCSLNQVLEQLKSKEQECEELRTDIKDIANLLDLDTGEEYNFGNIEIAIKGLKQECEMLKDKLNCCFCNPIMGLDDIENFKKCVETTECFRRQLDHLKEQLEAYKMEAEEGKEINAELKAENEKLKEFQKLLEEQMKFNKSELELSLSSEIKKSEFLLKEFKKVDKQRDNWRGQAEKLKQTLTEIKEIAENVIKNVSDRCIETTPMYGIHKQILQICDEVLK